MQFRGYFDDSPANLKASLTRLRNVDNGGCHWFDTHNEPHCRATYFDHQHSVRDPATTTSATGSSPATGINGDIDYHGYASRAINCNAEATCVHR